MYLHQLICIKITVRERTLSVRVFRPKHSIYHVTPKVKYFLTKIWATYDMMCLKMKQYFTNKTEL